jgi:hypothetical protein
LPAAGIETVAPDFCFMSLINPALLYGLGLVAVPLLLHLLMKAKPKKLLFPALQLIQKRRMQNTRRLRLRHLWLLLLRMLVLGALIAALTRPSLPAAEYSPSRREWLTMAAIGAVLLGAYFGLLTWWKRKRVPNHTLTSRRTSLRGGLGFLAFLLFALLVAWPYQKRIAAEISAPLPDVSDDLPVAAVFLFDTSASMDYRLQGKTRLDIAKEIAIEHLSSLPSRSQVAVGDTSVSADFPFQVDLAGAQGRIESLDTKATAVPLNQRLRTALALQEDDRKRTLEAQGNVAEGAKADQLVREIYIFTDLAASGWQPSAGRFLTQELKRLSWVGVYLIDVGVKSHQNASLTNLQISEQSVAEGETVVVSADVTGKGYDGQLITVEFYVEGEKGRAVKQDQRNVKLKDDSPQHVEFSIKSVAAGTTQGELRLVTGDPLTADNTLRFSVLSRPNARVLVVAEASPLAESDDLEDRLAAGEKSDSAALLTALEFLNFEGDFASPVRLAKADLSSFDVISLVNVADLDPNTWKKLAGWVQSGGGLSVYLGSAQFGNSDGISPDVYNSAAAQSFLPARLQAWRKFLPEPAGFDLRDTQHPVLRKFDIAGATTEVGLIPVRWCWNVKPAKQSNVILRFTDRNALPAMVERAHGDGRTTLVTTGFTAHSDRRDEWSGLAHHWAFVVLTDQIVHYLSGRSQAVVNYEAGSEVLVPLDRNNPLRRYLLRKPGGVQLPGDVPEGESLLRLSDIDETGHFEVVAADPAQKFRSGFSVNLPLGESDFSRLGEADLDLLLGEGRYASAENTESLTRTVNTGRMGMEVFPLILGLVIMIFCLELIVANRFYEADQDPLPETSTAAA